VWDQKNGGSQDPENLVSLPSEKEIFRPKLIAISKICSHHNVFVIYLICFSCQVEPFPPIYVSKLTFLM